MNSLLTTLDPVTTTNRAKTILAKDGFTCSLITLEPGEETPRKEPDQVEEHVLFVVDGGAVVRSGDVTTMLSTDEAILIPKGKSHTIAAAPSGSAKILRVDVPPRQIVTPQILSVER